MTETEGHTAVASRFEPIDIEGKMSLLNRTIFVLLLFTAAFGAIAFGGVDQVSWIIFSLLAMTIVICWLADTWYGNAFLINRNILLLPPIALIVIGLIQLVPLFAPEVSESVLPGVGRSSISLDPYATRLFLVRLWVYAVFLAGALTFINTEVRLKKVVYFIVILGSLVAFYGILQRLASTGAIYGMRDTPQAIPFGPFVNQHHFAAFMEMTGGVAFGVLLGKSLRREIRILLALPVVVMGVATIMTSSRGGLLSFVSMIIFVTAGSLVGGRRSKTKVSWSAALQQNFGFIAAGIALLVLIIGSALFLGENNSVIRALGLSGMDDLTSGRSHFWPIALKVFFDHPILGAGLDAFGVAFTRYDTWVGVYRVEQAHNDYLQILADAGIAGFGCVAAFIFFLFRNGLRVAAGSESGFRRSAAIGALGGCFGILIHSFFDFPLRTPSNAFFFLLLAAIAVVAVRPHMRLTDPDR